MQKLKSYIKFEEMGVSKQNVLNGIMAAAGSDSSVNSETSNENINFEIKEEDTIPESEEILSPIVHDTTQNDIEIMPTVNEDNEIPEESEVASNVGDMMSNIKIEDIGKRVMVEGYDSIGTLAFYGDHVSKGGKRCGVILDDAVGRNNGIIGGNKYFECDDMKGVLVAPYKVKLLEDDSGTDEDKAL